MSRSTFRVREGVVGSALCGVELMSPNVACALVRASVSSSDVSTCSSTFTQIST